MPLIPNTMNPSTGGGGSDWSSKLLGKKLTESGGGGSNEVNFAKKELPANHRIVDSEGGMMTMDHVPDRLNIHVDKDGTVRKVTQG